MPARMALCIASVVALLFVAGCPKDPYDPDTWIEKLDDGDPQEAALALQRLQQLKDPKAIEPLGKFWRKHNYPSKVLRIIIDLASHTDADKGIGPTWEPAIPFLVEAIDAVDVGDQASIEDATVAADALGQAALAGVRDSGAVTTLINAANKKMPKLSPGQRVRIAAARALGYYGNDPRAVDTLIKLLEGDINQQPLSVNASAANGLAEAASPKAIQPLLKCVYQLPPIYMQCRTALAAIGEPVAPELIKIFQGKHDELNQFAKDNNFANNCDKDEGPGTSCQAPGNLKFKSASLLGDLRVKEAVPMLIAELSKDPVIAFYDEQSGAQGPPTHMAVLDALGIIGDPRAADAVKAYWKNPNNGLQTRPKAIDVYSMLTRETSELDALAGLMSNENEDEGIRLAAALAYGRLVNKKGQLAALQKMVDFFGKPYNENMDKADKADDPVKAQQFRDNAMSYKPYYDAFQQSLYRAEVGIACGDDVACLLAYLDANDIAMDKPGLPRAERALLELAKLGDKGATAVDKLLKHAGSTERFVRQGVLLALTKVAPLPCKKCEEELGKIIEAQASMTTLDYLTADTRIVMYWFRWAK